MTDRNLTNTSRRPVGPCVALTLVLMMVGTATAQQGQNVRFRHMSVEHGLSQEAVHAILQDSQGLIWLGTQDGLNRYDGYDVTVFDHDPKDPASLSNGWIWCLFEDSRGNLWIGTDGGGLNRFLPGREAFERFVSDPADPFSLSHDSIRAIYEDRHGMLWIGTDGGGLSRLDPDTRIFTRFAHDPSSPASLSDDRVRTIIEDSAGALWVGTDGGGIDIFDPASGNFRHLRHEADVPHSLGDDRVRVIRETEDGAVWIGTYENGLDRFDPATGHFSHFVHTPDDQGSLTDDRVRDLFQDSLGTLWVATDAGLSEWVPETRSFGRHAHDPLDPTSLSDDRVNAVVEDRGGVLWVGTYNGLNKWNLRMGAIELYGRDPEGTNGLDSDVITSFTEDSRGGIWIGTYGGGLSRLDPVSGRMTSFRHDPDDRGSLADDRVMALFTDANDRLWIGTFDGGLDRFDPATGRFAHFRHDPDDPRSLSWNGVTVITRDRFGTIWVGTYRGGLNRFVPETGDFVHYRHDPDNPSSLGGDSVLALHEDETGALWIGSDGAGLSRYDRRSGTFSHYRHDPDDPTSLSSDVAWAIHQDRRGGFWVGTQDGGLNYWDPLSRRALKPEFRRYLRDDGLLSSVVYGVLGDDQDNLWLSTSRGVTRLNPSTGYVKNYDVTHGLQGNDFNFGAQFRSSDGRMFFGGSHGFNAFWPEQVRDNEHAPPVILTEFLKFNKAVPLEQPAETPIELSYRDSVVGFEFAALDFTAPERNQFRYKLEGFDDDWNDVGNLRRVTYTNLRAGVYTLRVQASNNDGLWNEDGLALGLVVGTPPWRSSWAILLYALVVVAAVLAVLRHHKRKLDQQAEYSHRLEREVGERTDKLAMQNRELAQLNHKLQEVSVTDSLTGLWNRRYLANEIGKDLALMRRARIDNQQKGLDARGGPSADLLFLMMDLDGLKAVNDTYGHQAGDRAIVQMKEILVRACRQSDTLIRWGGDEFLLLGRQTEREDAAHLAERIRRAVEGHRFDLGAGDIARLSCSVGFTFFPFMPVAPDLFSWEQMLDLADRALYRAKQGGRNQWVGVLSAPGSDPAIVMKHKDDDLEQLARAGIIELHTGAQTPSSPDETDHGALELSGPRLVEHAG